MVLSRLTIAVSILFMVFAGGGCIPLKKPAQNTPPARPSLLVTLPSNCNTPDGCTVDATGNIILSIPNFNNAALIKAGKISTESPARMVMIARDNKVSTWYEFKPEDLHPETRKVGPMGCAFGPDGNLYVADNQLFYNGENKSRLLRIHCEDGRPVKCEVVVEGFIVANAVEWFGDTIYVSETILEHPVKVEKGQQPNPLISGVYAFRIDEFKNGPVRLAKYDAKNPDTHLVAVYKTSGRIGFGADGLAFDGNGSMYCGIFEDGILYRTTFDSNRKPLETSVFAKSPTMACCDGITWRKDDNCIYVVDMLQNAIQVVDSNGNVRTLHKNGDTTGADGSLDQPCEARFRGSDLIVINMDMPWESDALTNKQIDEPYTVSVIHLK